MSSKNKKKKRTNDYIFSAVRGCDDVEKLRPPKGIFRIYCKSSHQISISKLNLEWKKGICEELTKRNQEQIFDAVKGVQWDFQKEHLKCLLNVHTKIAASKLNLVRDRGGEALFQCQEEENLHILPCNSCRRFIFEYMIQLWILYRLS